jgi:hypothetical protein
MLSVTKLGFMLSVTMANVFMHNVVVPIESE